MAVGLREELNRGTLPSPDEKHAYVRAMFDAIAPRYDLMNSLLSVRFHHRWRRFAADQAALHGLLRKVRDLGLPLISVTPAQTGQADGPDFERRIETGTLGRRKDGVN